MKTAVIFLLVCMYATAADAQPRVRRVVKVELLSADTMSGWAQGVKLRFMDGRDTVWIKPAWSAWVVMNGAAVALASDGGAGGYENEGQSLHLFDATTGMIRHVLSEYYIIDSVRSVRLSNKKWVLLVMMSDGGLGAERLAVVDPLRDAEVAFRNLCRVRRVSGDVVTLAYYTAENWSQLVEGTAEEARRVKPQKVEELDLKKAVKGRAIVNKRKP